MAGTEWNEVGERFTVLGQRLQRHLGQVPRATEDADEQVRSALDDLGDALDRLGGAITAGVNDPEVREAASAATAGVIDAMSTSLGRIAERVEHKDDAGEP